MLEDKDGKLERAWRRFCEVIRDAKTKQDGGEAVMRATLNCGGVTTITVTKTESIK